jgi:hypothetical protein
MIFNKIKNLKEQGRTIGITIFIRNEYEGFQLASQRGDVGQSWNHLQRIHIVSQYNIYDHVWSHFIMLRYATQIRFVKEMFGQMIRLILAPLGNLTGRIPFGNRGTSDVSPFLRETIPNDLKEFINDL